MPRRLSLWHFTRKFSCRRHRRRRGGEVGSIQYTVYNTQLSGVESGNHTERSKAAEASEASYPEKKTAGTSWRLVGASWRLVGASWRLVGSPFCDPSNGAC